MSRRGGRTQECTPAHARARLTHARKFLEAAELVAIEEPDSPESANVAASLKHCDGSSTSRTPRSTASSTSPAPS